jgi:ATP adenylyltransferase
MSKGSYDFRHARVEAQMEKMKLLVERGICAFCEAHFEEYHDNPIEFQTKHWIVSRNDYPYVGTSLHLLLVPKEHVRFIRELSPDARTDMMAVLVEIEQRWQLPSYAIGMRVGDPAQNGGSVEHMHAHVIVGDRNASGELVRFKMTSRQASENL